MGWAAITMRTEDSYPRYRVHDLLTWKRQLTSCLAHPRRHGMALSAPWHGSKIVGRKLRGVIRTDGFWAHASNLMKPR